MEIIPLAQRHIEITEQDIDLLYKVLCDPNSKGRLSHIPKGIPEITVDIKKKNDIVILSDTKLYQKE